MNFGPDPAEITVSFISGTTIKTCQVIAALTTDTTITCQTGPGKGIGYRFQVTIGSGSYAYPAVLGFDTYAYAAPPLISSISGCSDSGIETLNCPTTGLDPSGNTMRVTITGSQFAGAVDSVTIGGRDCIYINSIVYDTQITCVLPAGLGLDVLVVVNRGKVFSDGYPLVSYTTPTLYSVSGCQDIDNATVGCNRLGIYQHTHYHCYIIIFFMCPFSSPHSSRRVVCSLVTHA